MDIIDRFIKEHATALESLDKLKGALQGYRVGTPSDQDKKNISDFSSLITSGIRKHFHDEEEKLFKPLGKAIGLEGGPVDVMYDEHDILYNAFDRYQLGVQQQNFNDITTAGQEIYDLLTKHIEKEEKVLFPMARKTLSDAQLKEPATV